MKIKIKDEKGKSFTIHLPMWLIRMGLSDFVIKKSLKHVDAENKKHVEKINFKSISKAFNELKQYKGLEIVEIESKDGTEVKITV